MSTTTVHRWLGTDMLIYEVQTPLSSGEASAPAGSRPPTQAPPRRSAATGVRALGARQLAVLAVGGLEANLGLAASDVAAALGYRAGNATNVLKRLEQIGELELVSNERPARWRRVQ